ncbi:MAG: glycosyltransferase family 4 protein [Deltaproteobacteria bacterium]|nr:glycosyltransferase family 4 protein [Deltaproteobacteria bacterium]
MRIAITTEITDDPEPTGCQYYASHLINELLKRGDLDITLIGSDRFRRELFPDNAKTYIHKPFRIMNTAFFSSLINPPRRLDEFDIIHCPVPIAPFFFKPKAKVVMSIHDLIPNLFPQYNTVRRNIYFKYLLKHRLNRVDKLISVSESTRQDLIRLFHIPPERITTVYEGVDEQFQPTDNPKEDFILAVSTLEPRKNLKEIINSYIRLKKQYHISAKLFLVGRCGWYYHDILKVPAEYRDDVKFLGYVPRDRLVELYQTALFFVFPSFYEGFGLPVLEAMACGCPVITSNQSSLPEVGGQACHYVDPYKPSEMDQAIHLLLTDETYRTDLTAGGLVQAQKFTWKKCAEETLAVYKSMC